MNLITASDISHGRRKPFESPDRPEFVLKPAKAKRTQTALDDRLLQGMAAAAGGRFLREEELHLLPDWISATSTRVASYRNVDLYASPWILAGLLAILFSEWLMRRLTRLK